uniref:MLLT6, PHD finger containing n=1 Tax=Hucho hucho TaxID=62062 RepID=A0A4W5PAB4_9TELE
MREMVGGCCVCSDERGWAENPLVYCDGHGCSVAVHQACYGIVQVPTGPWFCRKCESQERAARVRCELCPHKDGALKRTDSGGWAHVVCALYIPEVQFANVLTMEPIVLQYVPHDRYIKTCYICEDHGRESKAACGACMTCNRQGCRQAFHVTCAQMAGLLCEEEGPEADNVKYCGYCKHHYSKMVRDWQCIQVCFHLSMRSPHLILLNGMKCGNVLYCVIRRLWKGLTTSTWICNVHSHTLSSGHHSNKDSEGNSKRLSSHGQVGHRSKKTGSIGKSCSSSSCSSSPFNAEEKEEEEELDNSKYRNKASLQPPALTPVDGPHGGSSQGQERSEGEANSFETKVTISTFGSIMRITSSSGGLGGGSSKLRKISSSSSSGDYKLSKSLLKSPHLATPPILEEADLEEDKVTPPPPLPTHRERRHRGNKKSRHGPGRPRGSKNRERTERREEEYRQHHHHTAPAPPPSLTSSTSFSSLFPNSSTLPHTAYSSTLLSGLLSLLSESEMDDCRFPCHDNSPRESLSSQSPMSSLPLLFDQRESVGPGVRGRPENVPPSSSHIELLLEKHGNGEMGANIVEMLQSLHSLQQENQHLQDQILSLTAKKERLQLLNVELACPFPPQVHHSHHSAQGLVPTTTHAHISFLSSAYGQIQKTLLILHSSFTSSQKLSILLTSFVVRVSLLVWKECPIPKHKPCFCHYNLDSCVLCFCSWFPVPVSISLCVYLSFPYRPPQHQ